MKRGTLRKAHLIQVEIETVSPGRKPKDVAEAVKEMLGSAWCVRADVVKPRKLTHGQRYELSNLMAAHRGVAECADYIASPTNKALVRYVEHLLNGGK